MWKKYAVGVFSVLLLFACGGVTHPGGDGPVLCHTDNECPIGQYCDDGICVPGNVACSDLKPCPGGQVCRNGACVGGGDGGADGWDGEEGGGDTALGPDIEIVEPLPTQGQYQLNFGNVRVGVAAEQRVVERNAGGGELRISNLNFEAGAGREDFSIPADIMNALPLVLGAGQERAIPVVYLASDGLTDHVILDIISNDADESLVQIHLLSEFKGEAAVVVDRRSLDFGDVEVGQTSQPLNFMVSNSGTGNAVLTVQDIRLGTVAGEDFSLEVRDANQRLVSFPALVNNGDGLTVSVVYHPKAREEDRDKVVVASDDPLNQVVEVSLSGRGVTGEVTLTPSPVNLGQVRVGGTNSQEVTISNNGGAAVQLTGVEIVEASGEWGLASSDLDLGSLSQNPYALSPGQSVKVTVSFSPVDEGAETARLVVHHSGPEAISQAEMNAEGVIPPAIEFVPNPPVLAFGDVQLDEATGIKESKSLPLVISNRGGQPLIVSNIQRATGTSTEFSWTPAALSPVAPGEQTTLNLKFEPQNTGQESGFILLDTNDPDISTDGVTGRAAIQLSARGVDPTIFTQPANGHDFGSLAIGDSRSLEVIIRNASIYPLVVERIGFTAGSSGFYGLSNLPVLPLTLPDMNAQASFTVIFHPTSLGTYTAAVEIASSDIGNPVHVLNFTGKSEGCPAGWGDCDSNPANGCETQLNSLQHCGACNVPCNLNHASESCSTGQCLVTSCDNGWCNLNNVTNDGCEYNLDTNPACSTSAPQIGSISGDDGNDHVVYNGRGEGWFILHLRETNADWNECIYLSAHVYLTSPASTNYDLYVYCHNCGGRLSGSSTTSGQEVVANRWDEGCVLGFPDGEDDSGDLYINVRFVSGNVCDQWRLDIYGNYQVSGNTCPTP